MAKCEKNSVTLVRLLVALGIILVTVASAFTVVRVKANSNGDDIAELKDEGCDQSGENEKDIIGIKKDVEVIRSLAENNQAEQRIMRTEQREGFREVLKELKK